MGDELRFLDRAAVRAEVHSPLRQAGLLASPKPEVFLDPARLVRGLARGCHDRAVVLQERARVAWLVRR